MAGGKGTRMRPLTDHTPKPLLEVQGKPILHWSLLSLRDCVDRVLIVVNYLQEQVAAYMEQQTLFANYQLVDQLPTPQGTGHALQCCRHSLESESFIVINGDDLFEASALKRLAAVELGVMTLLKNNMAPWGVVVTDGNGRVMRLHEKPPEGSYPLPVHVNIGAYKLNRSVFEHELSLSPRGEYEITDYVSYLASIQKTEVVPAAHWLPIGNPGDLAHARKLDIESIFFPHI